MEIEEIEFMAWAVRMAPAMHQLGRGTSVSVPTKKILLSLGDLPTWRGSAKSFGRWLAARREALKVQLVEYGVEMDWQDSTNRRSYSFKQMAAGGGSLSLADLEQTAKEMAEAQIKREQDERAATERERLERIEQIAAWAKTVVERRIEHFLPTAILAGALGRQVSHSEGQLFAFWLKESEHYYTVQDRLMEEGIWFSRNPIGDTNSYIYRVHR